MFKASAVRTSACAALVALGLWQGVTPASAMASPAPPTPPRWIISQTAVSLLDQAGMTKAQLQILFGNNRTYMTGTATAPLVSGALRTVTFTSYQTMEKELAGPGVPAGTAAVLYDNEDWNATPAQEQRDPAAYEELAAKLAHAHHLLLISTPATDLTDVLAPTQSDHFAAYLRLGLAASAARYADAIDVQAQGSEASLSKFTPFVEAAAAQARAANPHVIVLAGLSTNPSGQVVSSAQFTSAYNAVRAYVNGYWLNIPAQGTACPKCGTPQPKVAIPLLQALAR